MPISAALLLEAVRPASCSRFWSRGRPRDLQCTCIQLKISQSVAELSRFNRPRSWMWSEVDFDHMEASEAQFSTHTPNLVRMSLYAAEICPEMKFIMVATDGLFLLPVAVLSTKLPPRIHIASAHRTSPKSENPQFRCCKLSILI